MMKGNTVNVDQFSDEELAKFGKELKGWFEGGQEEYAEMLRTEPWEKLRDTIERRKVAGNPARIVRGMADLMMVIGGREAKTDEEKAYKEFAMVQFVVCYGYPLLSTIEKKAWDAGAIMGIGAFAKTVLRYLDIFKEVHALRSIQQAAEAEVRRLEEFMEEMKLAKEDAEKEVEG